MKKTRTKTMQGIIEQYQRISAEAQEHKSLRDRSYMVFCRYINAIYESEKYWNLREHVVKCIEGRVGSDGKMIHPYPEIGKLTKEEKKIIAERIADTVVRFTRQEYAGF